MTQALSPGVTYTIVYTAASSTGSGTYDATIADTNNLHRRVLIICSFAIGAATFAGWLLAAFAFVGWLVAPVVDDTLLRAELGYFGAAALLCALLLPVYRRA